MSDNVNWTDRCAGFDWHDHCRGAINSSAIKWVQSVPLTESGVLPSEMALFVSLCMDSGAEIVVESGRHHGFSTRCLVNAMNSQHCNIRRIESYETDPVAESDEKIEAAVERGLYTPYNESGEKITSYSVLDCAVLLDGPKGERALRVAETGVEQCKFAAIHDMSRLSETPAGSQPNGGRLAAERSDLYPDRMFFTDDPEFVERWGHLDERRCRVGRQSREELTKHGFVLCVMRGGRWRT